MMATMGRYSVKSKTVKFNGRLGVQRTVVTPRDISITLNIADSVICVRKSGFFHVVNSTDNMYPIGAMIDPASILAM